MTYYRIENRTLVGWEVDMMDLNFVNELCFELGYPFVVMVYLFTFDWKVFLFDRSDNQNSGPITGGVEVNEVYTDAVIREVEEETSIDIPLDWICRGDSDYVSFTPRSHKKKTFIPFSVFLPASFNHEKEIKLNNELSSYRLMELKDAAQFLDSKALPESREVFRHITGY